MEEVTAGSTFFLDCYDFSVAVFGAADINIEGLEPNSYNYFDEIPFAADRLYTCSLVRETVSWKHIR